MNATTEWSEDRPATCGIYLVQYTGNWFPEGDPNNLEHILVHVVNRDLRPTLLIAGRFVSWTETKGWKWAKVITAP